MPSEASALARELAAAYRGLLEYYREQYKLPPPEALAKVDSPFPPYLEENAVHGPADQVSWHDLGRLAEHKPELAEQCWERVKQAARDELASGHRAAKAMEGYYSHPWKRAQFLAVREQLAQEWRPRSGVEWQLIDTMAQAQTAMLTWMDTLATYTSLEVESRRHDLKERARWNPPRISENEAVDQAAAMVDRFNKSYLRTLRDLRDLRRYTPAVFVQNAGQVNVGGQQVNVAG
jgi:hypothetical protein